ncbi:MAG: hypothetical protein AABW72_05925 [archaeon]
MNEADKYWEKIQNIRKKEAISIGRTLIIALLVSVLLIPFLILLLDENISFAIYFIIMTTNIIWIIKDIMEYEENIFKVREKIRDANLDNSQ